MPRFRPVSKIQGIIHQPRYVFAGAHNDLHRKDNRILVQAQQALALLTANAATFPTPPSTLVDFSGAIDAHRVSVQNLGFKGNRGSRLARDQRDTTRVVLYNMLAANAAYVQAVARTLSPSDTVAVQVVAIGLGGYGVKKQGPLAGSVNRNGTKLQHQQLSAPRAIHIVVPRLANPGTTRLRWSKVKGASAYRLTLIEATMPAPTVTVVTTTSASYLLSKSRGIHLTATVQAVGPRGIMSGGSQSFHFVSQ